MLTAHVWPVISGDLQAKKRVRSYMALNILSEAISHIIFYLPTTSHPSFLISQYLLLIACHLMLSYSVPISSCASLTCPLSLICLSDFILSAVPQISSSVGIYMMETLLTAIGFLNVISNLSSPLMNTV